MAGLSCTISWQTRPAFYTPNIYRAKVLQVQPGSVLDVDVLGLYQVSDGEDIDAYFIVEMSDGKCTYASVEEIQFADRGIDRC